MKITTAVALIPVALAVAAGCSSAPPAAPAPSAAPVAASPAAASMGTAKPVSPETAATRKLALGFGLKPRAVKGTELYCRELADLGTRLPHTSCYTAAQIHDLQVHEQSSQDNTGKLQKASLAVQSSN